MTPDDTLERHLMESMASVAASGSPDYLDDILGRSSRTRQRRAWPLQRSVFPASAPHLRPGWRTGRSFMSPILRIAVVAALALAVGAGVLGLRQRTHVGVSDPSPSATPEPTVLPSGPLSPGTYVTKPFAQPGSDACFTPPQASCIDGVDDDAIRITLSVPEGWEGSSPEGVYLSSETERAALIFVRGASLAVDPCHSDGTKVIPVGPSVNNFERALRVHPLLAVTDAVNVTLGGRTGKYMELQVPDDPTIQGSSQLASGEGCPVYRPWNPWYLAQGPGEVWHLWILDVDGVRVVVQAIDDVRTSADAKAQLQAIVDSVRIERPAETRGSPSPASLTWSSTSLTQDWPAAVRAEPGGTPILVPDDGGSAPDASDYEAPAYHDPVGDVEPSWIDITTVRPDSSHQVSFSVAGPLPSPLPDPAGTWIAYGLVVDDDGDGVADTRLGVDNLPAGGGHRAWQTDLATGRTESAAGAPYGLVGDHYLDTFYANDDGPSFSGIAMPRFYAWASVIEDGRILATDYAPDAGWLD